MKTENLMEKLGRQSEKSVEHLSALIKQKKKHLKKQIITAFDKTNFVVIFSYLEYGSGDAYHRHAG